MSLPLHPKAMEELLAAVDWYEAREPGLGADLLDEIEAAINVISDVSSVMPRNVNVGRRIQGYTISPDGKRGVFAARGELFNVPAEEGYILNMTASSGALDRDPAWSPDGKYIAYWSDASGENEIYLRETAGSTTAKKLTSFGKGFGFNLFWSPDSKKIVFIDAENLRTAESLWLTWNSNSIPSAVRVTFAGAGMTSCSVTSFRY